MMIKKYGVYVAAGWFTPNQIATYEDIHNECDKFEKEFKFYYPKEEFQFTSGTKPDKETMERVFNDNIRAIDKCDFVICSTEDKDLGSIWESGYAYKADKPVIYVNFTVPANVPFNLMLANSGLAIARDVYTLNSVLSCIISEGLESKTLLNFKYQDIIE